MSCELLHCYNKACGVKFSPDNNKDDSCQHHPGVPVFHDALKGWSCCKKRTTDFTEFLKIPGCTFGKHNPKKPAEEMKPVVDSKKAANNQESVVAEHAPSPVPVPVVEDAPLERPSEDEVLEKLSVKTSPSYDATKVKAVETNVETGIEVGTSCRNAGCNAAFTGGAEDKSVCIYHPGSAIFHEGMKYWSCCQRKTSDFTAFLNQQGCGRGSHVWKAKEESKTKCRYDFHQAGPNAVLSIFAKRVNAETSTFEANRVLLKIGLDFENGKHFDLHLRLFGVIDPSRTKVTISMTKAEVSMRKVGVMKWKNAGEEIDCDVDAAQPDRDQAVSPATVTNNGKDNDSDSDLDGIDDVTFD